MIVLFSTLRDIACNGRYSKASDSKSRQIMREPSPLNSSAEIIKKKRKKKEQKSIIDTCGKVEGMEGGKKRVVPCCTQVVASPFWTHMFLPKLQNIM